MNCNYVHYDEVADVAPVDQFGFVDAAEAFRSGIVQGNLHPVEDDYNGMEDPNQLADYQPQDVFDTIAGSKNIVAKASEKAAKISEAAKNN